MSITKQDEILLSSLNEDQLYKVLEDCHCLPKQYHSFKNVTREDVVKLIQEEVDYESNMATSFGPRFYVHIWYKIDRFTYYLQMRCGVDASSAVKIAKELN